MTNRTPPPHSLEAEMSILGSVFLDNDCLKHVNGLVDALDFYQEPHREIFRTMLSLNLQRKPIDLVTTVQALKDSGQLEAVGGAAYLAELCDYTPTSVNVAYYCRIVKEKSAARQVIDFAGKLTAQASNGGDITRTLAEGKERFLEIIGSLDGLNGVSAADIVPFHKRRERYAEYIKSIGKSRFKTGFSLLDRQIRGVAPGELLIIIAYSGTFKTAFLQNLLLRGAEATGFYHLFFSLEMPVEKVFEREMQIQGGVSGWDVEGHFSGHKVSQGVVEGLERVGSLGLLVCDMPRLTLEKIGRYVEIAQQKYGKVTEV